MKRKIRLIPTITLTLFSFLFVFCNPSFGSEEKSGSFSNLFGGKGGYLHPFFSTSVASSDNIASTHVDDASSDTKLTASPGIWLAFPASKQQLMSLSSASTAPGGLSTSRTQTDYFKRIQTYLLLSADYESYSEYTGYETQVSTLEGLLQFYFKGGLTFELLGQYSQTADDKELSETAENATYKAGYLEFLTAYDISETFRLAANYSDYQLMYDRDENDAKNRRDNSTSVYLYSAVTKKTKIYLQLQTININYIDETSLSSTQDQIFGGINWQATAKTSGSLKIGQGYKKYDEDTFKDAENTLLELSMSLNLTKKTSLNLSAGRTTKEASSSATENYILSQTATLGYTQGITDQLGLTISLTQLEDDYLLNEVSTKYNQTQTGKIGLGYTFNKWLKSDVSYTKVQTTSDSSSANTASNTLVAMLSASF